MNRSHYNATVPHISQLPLELIIRILISSVSVEDWSISRLQELAQVSKAWRGAVLGTPELWAIVKIHRRPDVNPRWREDLELVLEKSGHMLLTVVYNMPAIVYTRESFITDLGLVGEAFDLVGTHAWRWRTVIYDGILTPTIAAILQLPSPALHSFTLMGWNTIAHRGQTSGIEPLDLSSGKHLLHVNVSHARLTWHQLKGLRTLCLDGIERGGPTAEGLLEIMRSCPDLETLKLCRIGDQGLPGQMALVNRLRSSPLIVLPSLQCLHFRGCDLNLVLAFALGTSAAGGLELQLDVNWFFLKLLPDFDSIRSIGPAFDSIIAHGAHLYITQTSRSLTLQSDWDPLSKRDASRAMTFYNENHEETSRHIFDFIQFPARPVPVHLEIGNDPSGHASPMMRFPPAILDHLVDLRLCCSAITTHQILAYLSQPSRGLHDIDGSWPCPQLATLWLQNLGENWDGIIAFLDGRYGERWSETAPVPLQTLMLGQSYPPQEVLARIPGAVGTVKLIVDPERVIVNP
ncbi:hypothetical protein FRB95_011549 [Tulasnella sp. JGI-2019a]|nr:hypothetical protein FRB95_011549 [Tulasnella sp. JGI-2019a]